MSEAYTANVRDRLAVGAANLCLRFATPYYRRFFRSAIHVGLNTAIRDGRERGCRGGCVSEQPLEWTGVNPPGWPDELTISNPPAQINWPTPLNPPPFDEPQPCDIHNGMRWEPGFIVQWRRTRDGWEADSYFDREPPYRRWRARSFLRQPGADA